MDEAGHFFTYPGNMGKEQDLIQAAKSGNVAHIEKILGHKARKSGIQRCVACSRKCVNELLFCFYFTLFPFFFAVLSAEL